MGPFAPIGGVISGILEPARVPPLNAAIASGVIRTGTPQSAVTVCPNSKTLIGAAGTKVIGHCSGAGYVALDGRRMGVFDTHGLSITSTARSRTFRMLLAAAACSP
jgi:hypothetical protein